MPRNLLVDGRDYSGKGHVESPPGGADLKDPIVQEENENENKNDGDDHDEKSKTHQHTSPSPQAEDQDHDHDSHSSDDLIAYAPGTLFWGPWHIPGLLGILNNAYACAYMTFVIFWSVWPPDAKVTPASMNYSVLVTGAVILFSVFWYLVRGRWVFRGPLVERDVVRVVGVGSVGV